MSDLPNSQLPNFDQLVKLAQENPEELERIRQEQVNQLIDKAPEQYQRRLRGIQFQIDSQREIHSDSPMGSCVKISKMMHESFAELRGYLNKMTGLNDPLRSEINDYQAEETKGAKVLPFPAN